MLIALNILFFLTLSIAFLVPVLERYTATKIAPLATMQWTIPYLEKKIDFELSIPNIVYLTLLAIGLVFFIANRNRLGQNAKISGLPPNWTARVNKRFPRITPYLKLAPGILLAIISLFYFSRDLSSDTFVDDEYQVITTAVGYNASGEFRKWDFCTDSLTSHHYTRAFPHTWLVAQSFALFGVSEWSARIPSALFGTLCILAAYLLALYFAKSALAATLLSLTLMWHPSLQSIFGIARMYALLIPLFLAMLFCFHRAIVAFISSKDKTRINKTVVFVLLSILLLFVTYIIHINSLIICFYALVFVLALCAYIREKRILLLAGLGLLVAFAVFLALLYTDLFHSISNHVAVFEKRNFEYIEDLLEYPFTLGIGIVFYVFALVIAVMTKDRRQGIQLISLISLHVPAAIFFVFCADRYYSFKYASFLVPTSMLLIVLALSSILDLIRNPFIRAFVFMIVFASVLLAEERPTKFTQRRPKHEEAYAVLREKVDLARNEIIFAQFMRCYYFRNIEASHNYVNLLDNRQLSFEEFISKATSVPSGWVIWTNGKGGHIHPKIRKLVRKCFKRHRFGRKKGPVNVFLYHFDQDRPCLRKVRSNPDYIRSVIIKENDVQDGPDKNQINLDISRPFFISFWLKSDILSPGTPISIGGDYKNEIILESRKKYANGGLRVRYAASGPCHALSTGYVNDGKWHLIALYQTGGQKGSEYGIYVDNERRGTCTVPKDKSGETRFLVNQFVGTVQDIRIYLTPLSASQLETIYNKGTPILQTALTTDSGDFTPAYHLINTNLNPELK